MFVTHSLLLSLGADCCMFLMLLLKLCNYVKCESEKGRVYQDVTIMCSTKFEEARPSVEKI